MLFNILMDLTKLLVGRLLDGELTVLISNQLAPYLIHVCLDFLFELIVDCTFLLLGRWLSSFLTLGFTIMLVSASVYAFTWS